MRRPPHRFDQRDHHRPRWSGPRSRCPTPRPCAPPPLAPWVRRAAAAVAWRSSRALWRTGQRRPTAAVDPRATQRLQQVRP